MSCNNCATKSAGAAAQQGAPDIEAARATNTGHGERCPGCGEFVSPQGGHVCEITPEKALETIQDALEYLNEDQPDDALYLLDSLVGDSHWHGKAQKNYEAGDEAKLDYPYPPPETFDYRVAKLADALVYLDNDQSDDALYVLEQLADNWDYVL